MPLGWETVQRSLRPQSCPSNQPPEPHIKALQRRRRVPDRPLASALCGSLCLWGWCWHDLADRLSALAFALPPSVQSGGEPGERWLMSLCFPSDACVPKSCPKSLRILALVNFGRKWKR